MPKTLNIPAILNDKYEMVAVDSLKTHPRNVRQGDLGAIVESIKANGFYGTCVVQKSTRYILVGNHRYLAALEAQIPAVPVVWIDCDDDRALRVMLSDNQTSDIANNNPNALAELLAELAGTPLELSGTGFDCDDLDELIASLGDFSGESTQPTLSSEVARKTLAERFLVPPFSVLDARQGYWQERKRAWIALGIQSEVGRGAELLSQPHKSTPGHGPTVRQNPDGTLNYNPPMPKYARHA